MDPVSLVVAAIVAGASTATQTAAGDAVSAAYNGLKSLLLRHFAGRREGEDALARTEESPTGSAEALTAELEKAGAPEDPAVIQAARDLLALTDPVGTQAGKYHVSVSDSKGVVVGDHATVSMTFDGD